MITALTLWDHNWMAFSVVFPWMKHFDFLMQFHFICVVQFWKSLWWRHQMETFSALLAICAENSPVPGEFSAQRPVTRSSDVFFDLRLNKRLSKHSWGWWFETLLRPLWRHRNVHWFGQWLGVAGKEGITCCVLLWTDFTDIGPISFNFGLLHRQLIHTIGILRLLLKQPWETWVHRSYEYATSWYDKIR